MLCLVLHNGCGYFTTHQNGKVHTKSRDFAINTANRELRQQIMNIWGKKSLKNFNGISNEGERSSKTLHGSEAERFYGKSKGEASMYS